MPEFELEELKEQDGLSLASKKCFSWNSKLKFSLLQVLTTLNKLSEFLQQYQRAFPNFTLEEYGLKREDERHQMWLSNSSSLPPLIREYEATLLGQQEHISTLENELERLKHHAKDLVQENERLHQELKDLIQDSMLSNQGAGGGDGEEVRMIQNLQQQIELALQEKEVAQNKWREASEEVDRLEAALEMEKESHQWKIVEQQAHQVKAQYQESVTTLNSELEQVHTELRECRAENSQLMQKVSQMKLTISELQHKLIWKAQETADSILKEGMSDSKMYELRNVLDDLKQRLSDISHENSELRQENSSLSARVMDLQSKLNESEIRENEAIIQVRNAVHMAEAAVVEKDQSEILMKKTSEELESMKDVLVKVINKAGERTREEVDNVKKQCNNHIKELTEELHTLEMEKVEQQARLDRLLREKRAVESELQEHYREGVAEGSKCKEAYEELNKRAIEAERGRDEAAMKLESLQLQLHKLTQDNKQLKLEMHSESKQLQDRLTQLQTEFEAINEDRINNINKLNELNKKLLDAQQERDAAYRKFNKELALLEQDQQVKTRNLEVKLQTTEDSRQQTVSELKRLLSAQQRMSARWKEECQTITHKFEVKLEDLQSELMHVKKRNEDLSSLLKESQIKTVEAERLLSDYTKNIRRLEERVRESEIQAGDAKKQLTRHNMKEKQMVLEKTYFSSQVLGNQRGDNGKSKREEVIIERNMNDLSGSSRKEERTLDHLSSSSKLDRR